MDQNASYPKTRRLVESALMIALATLLSEIKFGGLWAFGGGVTLCSMVPLILISYRRGVRWGSFTAFAYSLLQLLLGVDNLRYATGIGMAAVIILLDYIIAYTVIGAASMFRGRFRSRRTDILLGTVTTLGIRFLCHFITGWMIWGALWPNGFGMAAPVYSLVYNGSYMLPETILTAAVCCLLVPWAEDHLAK